MITLIWNDPDPIEGNDYEITTIKILFDSCLITYNKGKSEAEVPNWEIQQLPDVNTFTDFKIKNKL